MSEPSFTTCEAWMLQVESYLHGHGGEAMMRRHDVDRDAVLNVARGERDHADADGRSGLTHEQLALIVDEPRKTVARARLVLIDSGFEALESDPRRTGHTTRVLQRQPSTV